MATARILHTATLLPNGQVLIVGGINQHDGSLASAELYNPATGTWSTTASLPAARNQHTATLLQNGEVLVAGGFNSSNQGVATALLYDPASGTWSTTGSMAVARGQHTATLLPNGEVLVAGGYDSGNLANAELYNPTTGSWSTTASMANPRGRHTATLLSNGKVLVAGGGNSGGVLASAELYDPTSGTWSTTASMAAVRYTHIAALLLNGKVIVAGGANATDSLASGELYDPASGTWSTTGSMAVARHQHTATLLPNGDVLVAGGYNTGSNGPLASAEIYDPTSGTWSTTASMATSRYVHTATLLPNGNVLVAGGETTSGAVMLASAELYEPVGLLRVVSSPALPSQISVDGQIADSWGMNWMKIQPGSHVVCFTHVEGWTEPPCQTVTVNAAATTMVTGNFTQRGFLRVITSPAVPSQIKVDGSPTDDWGMWTDIPTGSHTVCFGAVAGFNPPACQTMTVNAGALATVTGTFTSNPSAVGQSGVGFLRAVTSPALPSQITIQPSAGSPYIADSWGLNWLELPPGSYTVTFSHVPGYTEPASQTVTITSGTTTTVTGMFIQRGTLRVQTSPAVAGTIFVDGIPRDDWGMWTDIPTGPHTVCFGPASGYANTAACQTVTVNAGVETDVTGTYS